MNNQVFTVEDLSTMTERSTLFLLIKNELKRRGYWKNKNRGSKPVRDFTRVNIHSTKPHQVSTYLPYKDDVFTDGL